MTEIIYFPPINNAPKVDFTGISKTHESLSLERLKDDMRPIIHDDTDIRHSGMDCRNPEHKDVLINRP